MREPRAPGTPSRAADRVGVAGGSSRLTGVASSTRAELHAGVGGVLVSAEEVQRRVSEPGEEISRDYAGRAPLLVGGLQGAVLFLGDLTRVIDSPVEVVV